MKNYEINLLTYALIPIEGNKTKVIEEDNIIIVNNTPTNIIDNSCRFFGSSYLGRHEGTKRMTGINYKTPIIVEESKNIIFFPTSSPRFNNCMWIALDKIDKYGKTKYNSYIQFKNMKIIDLDISYGSLDNQILRATKLESILRKRKFEK